MFPSLPRAYDWCVIDEVILHEETDPNYTKQLTLNSSYMSDK